MKTNNIVPSSFRDPAGFVFVKDNVVYRQINKEYQRHYRKLMDGGLYEALIKKKWMVCHEEVDIEVDDAYKVIRPQQIPFISYSYEWCFSQLKDAALLTLDIQELALRFGMTLKDSSSYNIQFLPQPIFIDTTSFEEYEEGSAWVGYRQFCRHFLAPLALMSYGNIHFNKILTSYIDGIPLDFTSSLLPRRTKFNISLLSHIHLHAKGESFEGASQKTKNYKVSKLGLLGIIDSLRSCIQRLRLKKAHSSIWSDYYEKELNYTDEAFTAKKKIIGEMLQNIAPQSIVDLGANRGIFSRVASEMGIYTISSDIDPIAIERNYIEVKSSKRANLLPLVVDITNPSPGIGWENAERESFFTRVPKTTTLALALIHHLVIANNLPFKKVATFFSRICKNLIIEFVPKSDSQVQRMLRHREDIFSFYTQQNFASAFAKEFEIKQTVPVVGSDRIIYLMERK